jgi:hypothetical protein
LVDRKGLPALRPTPRSSTMPRVRYPNGFADLIVTIIRFGKSPLAEFGDFPTGTFIVGLIKDSARYLGMRLEVLLTEAELAFELPPRCGPRPQSCLALPHIQLDQWPPPIIAEELLGRCLTFPNIRSRQSRMASPECRALSLPDEFCAGPPGAFIVDHEFCHLHPLPDSSIHLTLPKDVREHAIWRGWAEQHPVSRAGILPETLVMVYAPRNFSELAIVLRLVGHSYQFARGAQAGRR